MKKFLFAIFGASAVFLASCSYMTTKHDKGDTNSVKEAYYEWVKEVEAADGHPEKVVDLYAKDAILLPTLSPRIYTNKTMITSYFQQFLMLKDLQVETEKLIVREYGDIAMTTGFYSFYHKKDKSKHELHVRFDFWYKKIDGKWKIIFHQSSVLPSGK